MQTSEMAPIPADTNPFLHDLFHMGMEIGHNVTIMYAKHKDNDYIIVIDKTTGERLRVNFTRPEPKPSDM